MCLRLYWRESFFSATQQPECAGAKPSKSDPCRCQCILYIHTVRECDLAGQGITIEAELEEVNLTSSDIRTAL